MNNVGRGIFRGFVNLQSSAGHIGAQNTVVIPVSIYLGQHSFQNNIGVTEYRKEKGSIKL